MYKSERDAREATISSHISAEILADKEEVIPEIREIAVPQNLRDDLIDITKESRKGGSIVETPKLGGTNIKVVFNEEEREVEDWPQYLSEEEVNQLMVIMKEQEDRERIAAEEAAA